MKDSPLTKLSVGDLINFKEKTVLHTSRHGAVVKLEHNQTVGYALKVLAKHRILSAPLVMSPSLEDLGGALVEETSAPTLLGWVDIQDILKSLLAHVKKTHPTIPTSMLLLMQALEAAGRPFSDRTLVTLSGGEDRSLVYETESAAPLLLTVNHNLLNNGGQAGRVVHRLAVFDASGEVQHVVSQLDVIRLLSSQPAALLGAAAQSTLTDLGLLPSGPNHVVCVDPHVPTLIALDRMVTAGVSGAAVMSPAGELVANLSSSDLRGIQPEHLGVLALPVAEFLALLHGTSYLGYSQRGSQQVDHPFFAASRGLTGGPPSPGAAAPPASAADAKPDSVRLITCRANSTLQEVLNAMSDNHVHRVYVVDPEAKPQVIAVITPTDILKWLVAAAGIANEPAPA